MRSTSFFASVLLAAVVVTAGIVGQRGTVTMLAKSSLRHPDGAVYFITNEPEENMIVTASISSDGSLRLDRAVAAGGHGLHGVTANNGNTATDGLFSQGSIQASAKGSVLAAVNPGSNTVSLFSIDSRKPTNISPLGDPISSEGEFPVSLAFNDDGSRLCVLNGGKVNGVNCYTVDKKTGLVPIRNSLRYLGFNQITPANGPPGTVSQIIFSADGKKLLASYKGAATVAAPGYLAACDVQSDGSLSVEHTQIALARGGMLAFSLTPIPGENAFFVTDPGLSFDIVDLSGRKRDAAVPVSGQMATCWSARSLTTGSYYAIDVAGNVIREVQFDGNLKSTVVGSYSVPAGTAPLDGEVATIRGKDYLYVLGANATSVEVSLFERPWAGKAGHSCGYCRACARRGCLHPWGLPARYGYVRPQPLRSCAAAA